MKILVIGSGGREHAIIWKLSQSRDVTSLYCAPGNGGIFDIAHCVDIDTNNIQGLLEFAKKERIDITIVGPEGPLATGIVDAFEKEHMKIFGPSKQGALIETSKIFAKNLMDKYEIPTAPFKTFNLYNEALNYVKKLNPPFVIKADGLCAGKGAYVIQKKEDAENVIKDLLVNFVHGDAGKNIIIENYLSGVEASYIAFTDGKTMLPLLPSQDHKPLLDNDQGPNTGGMGAYTPIPFITERIEQEIKKNIMLKTIKALKQEGIIYKGALYGGLMIVNNSSYVLEFNARLGDPETQPIFFKMESDLLPILRASIEGTLHEITSIQWKPGVSLCVVIASKGYPEKPEKGKIIKGLDALKEQKDVMVFHGGTKKVGNDYYTSGGRVLGVTVMGSTYKDAIKKAYDAISCIEFDGMHYRKDIGKKALNII
jgi:phosphoribosylamine--glycine ligase